MSSGDDIGAAINAAGQKLKADLDKCKTKEDYEQFVRKKSNAIKWFLISGVVLIIITLILWHTGDGVDATVFCIVVGSASIVALGAPLVIRPFLKDAKRELEYINEEEAIGRILSLVSELLHDLSFVKEVSAIIFNREVSDFEAKILRRDYLYWETEETYEDGKKMHVFTDTIKSEDLGMTKQDIRNDILNTLRTNDKVKDWFYSTFKTTVEDYYDLTNQVFSKDEVISSCSKFWFGGSGDKYHSEIKEMCHWLENEKGHILSQLIINGGDDNWANILYDKKDIFLKLFNEWNSTSANVESNVINEESIEQLTTEAPKTPQEESNFGGIVLN